CRGRVSSTFFSLMETHRSPVPLIRPATNIAPNRAFVLTMTRVLHPPKRKPIPLRRCPPRFTSRREPLFRWISPLWLPATESPRATPRLLTRRFGGKVHSYPDESRPRVI